jgi:hypothetical protein
VKQLRCIGLAWLAAFIVIASTRWRQAMDETLPADVYGAIRGWKERAKTEAQKKRDAIAERDRLTEDLRVGRLEFESVFKACLCVPMSKRARAEIRRHIKNELGLVLESEMDEWVKKKILAFES